VPVGFYFRAAVIIGAAIFCVAFAVAWRADLRDRAQLASELAATKQLLVAADARQHDRDAQLVQTLATFAAEKRTVITPAQIIHDLPAQISLPAPIILQTPPSTPDAPTPKPHAIIPSEDLKPLYDFTLDCKTCQAKLASAQGDLTDERAKSAALTKERNAALKASRGGGTWRRLARAAKWFAIGAAAGAIAAKAR
jgi:hypothetical protein